jgi:hypothetical protein
MMIVYYKHSFLYEIRKVIYKLHFYGLFESEKFKRTFFRFYCEIRCETSSKGSPDWG